MSRFGNTSVGKLENSSVKSSKIDRYTNIKEDKFDEPIEYDFLNKNKVKYEDDRRMFFNIFMLIYEGNIDYNMVKIHIDSILSRRKKYNNDEIIYWLGNCEINDIVYKRTYIYLKLEAPYETIRSKFNIKINGEEIVPCIRIIDKKEINAIKSFIYNSKTNFPYDELNEEFERNKNKKMEDKNIDLENASFISSFTDTSYLTEKISQFDSRINT